MIFHVSASSSGRWLLGAVFGFLLVPPGRLRAETPASAPVIQVTLADGTGRCWGFTQGDPGRIYTLDEHAQWQPFKLPGITNRNAWSVTAAVRGDGTVVCLWKLNQEYYQCSEHRGDQSTARPAFRVPNLHSMFLTPHLFADSRGGMWLTAETPDLYRFKTDGTAECVYHVPDAACLTPVEAGDEIPRTSPITIGPADEPTPSPEKEELSWQNISVLEDASGKLWFWTDHADYFAQHGMTIRGALLFDGAKFVQHDLRVPGQAGHKPLTELCRKDARHLWMSREGDGLYTLDTTTLQSERVPNQPPGAEHTSFTIQDAPGDWLFVLGQSQPGGVGYLWRLNNRARWNLLVPGVDALNSHRNLHDRLWAQADHGGYLGSDRGLWYVPADSTKPFLLDWRLGRFRTADYLFKLPNGRWLGWNYDLPGLGSPDALEITHEGPDDPRIRMVNTTNVLMFDRRKYLWTTSSSGSHVLREWNGEAWIDHSLPVAVSGRFNLDVLNVDNRGWVWLRSRLPSKQTAIYAPAEDRWWTFNDFDQALASQAGHPEAEFIVTANTTCNLPRYHPDGRIVYRAETDQLRVFDGHSWRRWDAKEVCGKADREFDGEPFYNRSGRISVNLASQTWELAEGSRWQPIAHEASSARSNSPDLTAAQTSPRGLQPPPQMDASATDDQDSSWLIREGQLFRRREGLLAPVFAPDEAHPSIVDFHLERAAIDARGNPFLVCYESYAGIEGVILLAKPPPRTTLTRATPDAGLPAAVDTVSIRLTTDSPGADSKSRFKWRLDNGGWTTLVVDDLSATVTLNSVPGGSHRFEARSFGPLLQTDSSPAVLSFAVALDPQAQVAAFINQLADPDFSRREEAVAALSRQPTVALPALRAARAANTGTDSWWLDAAIQHAAQRK